MATAIMIGKGVVGKAHSLASPNLDKYIYGIEWDENDRPLKPKRIGNLDLHKSLPIQNLLKGVVAQNGKIMYYLDENDWAYKQDGTPSRLDGYDGEVQVEIPKFYLWHEEEGTIKRVFISLKKVKGATKIPHMLMDAYRATVLNTVPKNMGYLSTLPVNSAISVVNTESYCRGGGNRPEYDVYLDTHPERSDLGKPRTNISRDVSRLYCRRNNKEILCFTYYWAIFYWLYVIEYANFNSQDKFNNTLTEEGYKQGGLDKGVTHIQEYTNWNNRFPITPCGYNNNFGNFTGVNTIKGCTFNIISQNRSIDKWDTSNGAFVVNYNTKTINIVSSASSTSTIISTTYSNAVGAYTIEISGLIEGQSLIFKQGNTLLATIEKDGEYVIEYTKETVNRQIFTSFVGECNITIKTLVVPENQEFLLSFPDLLVPRWRGFDNPFGDTWINLEGVIIETDPNDKTRRIVYTTTNPELFGDTDDYKSQMDICGYTGVKTGWYDAIDLGNKGELLPKSINNDPLKYFSFFWSNNATGIYGVLAGSDGNESFRANLSTIQIIYSTYGKSNSIGFRLVKLLNQ